MTKDFIVKIIIETINEYFESQGVAHETCEDTILLGSKSPVDSLGLVNILVDLEANFLEHEINISFMSEKAISAKSSPFKSVSALADYVLDNQGD